ncbi:hard-surface induced protein 5 [Colletotrichum karsti]|uniref:Hard-surface induced protein 5 n=1 Tax=Colletotrichum karsti TaxID=1095194 RepID=A0A9P6I882_9PEZI|nr:hard-surface induced protein 5 [Colletotrichum karsti]KAF9876941.1 hard-surface induced protein 5 [Colletotrichum karsti]
MVQNPISSLSTNRRYLSACIVGATILLVITALRVSSDDDPAVLKSSTRWNSAAIPDEPGHAMSSTHRGKKDDRPTFADLAANSGTDKVTTHNYGLLYDKHLPAFRDLPVKILEIGLGCGLPYAPGASYDTWIQYFANLELNIIEQDQACGKVWATQNPKAKVFFGDPASAEFLHDTGDKITSDRLLDIVIDDGGHTMTQQEVSLKELWKYVRPGGIYIAEDLHTSFLSSHDGDPTRLNTTRRTFMRFVYELMDDYISVPALPNELQLQTSGQKYTFSHEVSSIECMEAMCVFMKKDVGAR